MLPYSYSSNCQIMQTAEAVVVHAELIHDTRVIHLDGRSHLSPTISWGWATRSAISGGTGICTSSNASACSTRTSEPIYEFGCHEGNYALSDMLSGYRAGVYVGSLDGTTPVRVLDGQDSALFAPSSRSVGNGHLLFRRQNTLMAQSFDPQALMTSGSAVVMATDVSVMGNTGYSAVSVASDGTHGHWSNANSVSELIWMDRSGTRQGVVTPSLEIPDFALARDGRRVAFSVRASLLRSTDVFLQVDGGDSPSRFTFGPYPGWRNAVWSPHGNQIAFATQNLAGLPGYEIRRKPTNMMGAEELLLRTADVVTIWDWSPDGKFLVFTVQRGGDLMLLPLEGARKPVLFAKTPGDGHYGQFSPDGKWMAYSAGPRGQTEVYVQPMPATGALWQISQGGGGQQGIRRIRGRHHADGALRRCRRPATSSTTPISRRKTVSGFQ